MKTTLIFVGAAAAALMVGCAPVSTGGADEGVMSLAGTYDVRPSECGNPRSETRMTIAGNRFDFYESTCTAPVADAETGRVVLACEGEGARFTRDVLIEDIAGGLRMTDDEITLTYQRCDMGQQAIDASGAAARSAVIAAAVM